MSPRGVNGRLKSGKLHIDKNDNSSCLSKYDIYDSDNYENNYSSYSNNENYDDDGEWYEPIIAGLVALGIHKLWKYTVIPFFKVKNNNDKSTEIEFNCSTSELPEIVSKEIKTINDKFKNKISEEEARKRLRRIFICSLAIAENFRDGDKSCNKRDR